MQSKKLLVKAIVIERSSHIPSWLSVEPGVAAIATLRRQSHRARLISLAHGCNAQAVLEGCDEGFGIPSEASHTECCVDACTVAALCVSLPFRLIG